MTLVPPGAHPYGAAILYGFIPAHILTVIWFFLRRVWTTPFTVAHQQASTHISMLMLNVSQ
jgi:hypothetical protein